MSDKRQQWEAIKEQAPDVADFLLAINQAFGKPAAVRVELFESGKLIEIGGRLKVDQVDSASNVCGACKSWRKDRPSDGAGVCTRTDRGLRSWVADWPTHPACELFDPANKG
jgi:hypothetical protein